MIIETKKQTKKPHKCCLHFLPIKKSCAVPCQSMQALHTVLCHSITLALIWSALSNIGISNYVAVRH